ncbi:EamA/RhaT family transporter [Candidatus Roizmanbacteria bacterium]|nr:EamA/RhaT family transporter [Candidatus Roizmanbacteria bacterium]
MNNKKIFSYFQLTLSMIFVGSAVLVGKYLINLSVIYVSFMSLVIASLCFFIFKGKEDLLNISRKDLLVTFFQALFGTFLYRIFFLTGIKYISGSEAGIISSLSPAIIGILAFIFLKEKLSKRKIIGVFLSVLGLIIINLNSNLMNLNLNIQIIIGQILILLSVVGQAIFVILSKFLSKGVDSFKQSAYVIFFSTLLFAPFVINTSFLNTALNLSIFQFLVIAYYGIFLSFISFLLWFEGQKKVSGTVAGIFTTVAPISSIILSIIFLNEFLQINQVVGAILVIGSIFVINNS